MKPVIVTDCGIVPSANICCADALEKLLNQCKENCEVILPEGVYFLTRRILISGCKNLTIRGENATIRTHFDNKVKSGMDGAFTFQDCENLTLKNLHFDTDVSPNISGTVCNIDPEKGCFDLQIFDEFPIDGDEYLEAINSVDDEYTPDYQFVTFDVIPHDYLGDRKFRFYTDLTGVRENQLMNIRHYRYGPSLVNFVNVYTALIEDVLITNGPGCVFVISPRSSDFTFHRFNIRLPENTKRLMASNADGIHVAGMTGKLVLKDCHFENLGDDALNIHSRACMACDVDEKNNTMQYFSVRMVKIIDPATHMQSGGQLQIEKSPMAPNWAQPGDLLYVYDHETVTKLGEVRVVSAEGTTMKYELVSGSIAHGNILANAEYFAATHIDGCSVRNTRARAFLLQTNNAIVENCHIYGMSLSAILLSPDIAYWYEVGPCTNVELRNNVIEKCNCCVHRSNIAAVVIKCRHEEGISDSPAGVHNNIRIIGNQFRNIGGSAVFALAVQDLQIKDNRFDDCCNLPFDETIESLKHDIALVNCDNVDISGNRSTHVPSPAHLINVTNLHIDL